jgi:hypothetical protein
MVLAVKGGEGAAREVGLLSGGGSRRLGDDETFEAAAAFAVALSRRGGAGWGGGAEGRPGRPDFRRELAQVGEGTEGTFTVREKIEKENFSCNVTIC